MCMGGGDILYTTVWRVGERIGEGVRVRAADVRVSIVDVVADGQEVGNTRLVIYLADDDVAIEGRVAVGDMVVRVGCCALTVGQRQVLQRRESNRIEPFSRDHVPTELLMRNGFVEGAQRAAGRHQVGEVALAIRRRREGRNDRVTQELPRPLPRPEEERLSARNRPAERPAELVQANRWFR